MHKEHRKRWRWHQSFRALFLFVGAHVSASANCSNECKRISKNAVYRKCSWKRVVRCQDRLGLRWRSHRKLLVSKETPRKSERIQEKLSVHFLNRPWNLGAFFCSFLPSRAKMKWTRVGWVMVWDVMWQDEVFGWSVWYVICWARNENTLCSTKQKKAELGRDLCGNLYRTYLPTRTKESTIKIINTPKKLYSTISSVTWLVRWSCCSSNKVMI